MKYQVKILEKTLAAENTWAVKFAKPSGFTFRAGQTIDVQLLQPSQTDAEGDSRAFSIASAPQEDFLMIAWRWRDTAFKNVLRQLPLDSLVEIDGPKDDFCLPQTAKQPLVLLAGGIGITPFFSMLKDAAARQLLHQLALFYSNRRPEDAPFLKELRELALVNRNFKFIPTMTDLSQSQQAWSGESGYINHAMLARQLDYGLDQARYYLAGPPAMVTAMQKMLLAAGVSQDDIRLDEFDGY